ncbi:MAG TPA: serine hydrolase [Roseiflexaceae bacterium]|nr:serine hydrolase [Roseiflexaceae bacterium]
MIVTQQLPRSAPEAQGVPSAAVLAFLEAAEREIQHLHSLMLVRRGHVLAEGWWVPYAAERPHMLFSLSKSFTSTAVGLAVAEGLLSVDDPVLSFFPEDAPEEVGEHLAAMRVRHLLSMSTGHDTETMGAMGERADGHWVRGFLSCPVPHPPGTHFLYNTGATYMLSAILQQLTGVTLLEYLRPRLLAPLGIEGATWQSCPRGINTGGFGLSTTTEAVANFGQLYLQQGVWQGQPLVPSAWVAEATAAQIANGNDPASDWAQGYGYQFWRCRHGAYRGDGAFGQYCIVLPEQEAVLAITGGLGPMQPVLDLVWEHLLPAFGPEALPADPDAQAALAQRLDGLRLPPPPGRAAPEGLALPAERLYRCEPNTFEIETVGLRFDGEGCTLTLREPRGEHRVVAGAAVWQEGRTGLMGHGQQVAIAAAGAWIGEDTYELTIWYIEAPFCLTLTFRVADVLLLDMALNVSFGPTTFPQIVGHAESAVPA